MYNLKTYNNILKLFQLYFIVCINLVQNTPASECMNSLNSLLSANKSQSTYLVKTSPVPTKALEIGQDNSIDKDKIYFILLPGNSGHLDTASNHNLGYDTFEHLIKRFGLKGSDVDNFESIENVLIRDGEEYYEKHLFRSQKGSYRTDEGQMFYRHFSESGKTIVLLRSNTNYNQGSSYFFMPVIEQIGGNTKNIVVIHDDLKSVSGSIQVIAKDEIKPEGNNSLKNLQFNLYASRILSFLDNKVKSKNILLNETNTSLLRNVRLALTDSGFDRNGTSTQVLKLVKKEVNELIINRTKILKSNIGQALGDLGKAKGMWAKEKDPSIKLELKLSLKKATNDLYSNFPEEMNELDELSSINKGLKKVFLDIELELYSYIKSIPTFEKYSDIKLGTGYNEWLQTDFSLTANPYNEEVGSLAHFVLSPYDQLRFDTKFFNEVADKVETLIFSLDK